VTVYTNVHACGSIEQFGSTLACVGLLAQLNILVSAPETRLSIWEPESKAHLGRVRRQIRSQLADYWLIAVTLTWPNCSLNATLFPLQAVQHRWTKLHFRNGLCSLTGLNMNLLSRHIFSYCREVNNSTGYAVVWWLRHCTTSRKVAGSRDHEVNDFFFQFT
jgi:hypothetical protein